MKIEGLPGLGQVVALALGLIVGGLLWRIGEHLGDKVWAML